MARAKGQSKDAPHTGRYRSRNEDGRMRAKRGDTRVGTIEEKYNVDLEMRSDAHLATALSRYGVGSLRELLEVVRASPARAAGGGPKNGAELVAYWQDEQLIGTRPDIEDSQAHARRVRERAERRGRA